MNYNQNRYIVIKILVIHLCSLTFPPEGPAVPVTDDPGPEGGSRR